MADIVILGSDDCDTCREIKDMISNLEESVDFVDIDTDEGIDRVKQMVEKGFKLDDLTVPQCVVVYNDGIIDNCDTEGFYNRLKYRLKRKLGG